MTPTAPGRRKTPAVNSARLNTVFCSITTQRPSAGNPHAAYDVAEAGNGVKGRTEAPGDGESRRPTATPRPCGYRASFRPYRRAATGNGATARSEAPALRKPPGTATPVRLPQPRQSPTLPFSATDPARPVCPPSHHSILLYAGKHLPRPQRRAILRAETYRRLCHQAPQTLGMQHHEAQQVAVTRRPSATCREPFCSSIRYVPRAIRSRFLLVNARDAGRHRQRFNPTIAPQHHRSRPRPAAAKVIGKYGPPFAPWYRSV